MSTTAAPPYVSLLDRLRTFGKALRTSGHSHGISAHELSDTLTALAIISEHGQGILDDFDQGGFDKIEPILTPDRPEGWTPIVKQGDAKDDEIMRLHMELDSLREDPREKEAQRLRDEIRHEIQAAKTRRATPPVQTRPPDWAPDPSKPPGGIEPGVDPDYATRAQADAERQRNEYTQGHKDAGGNKVTVDGQVSAEDQAKIDALKADKQ